MTQTDRSQQPDATRRNRADNVGRDAGSLAATAFARVGFADPTLVLRWPQIVGSEVARIARPIRLTSEGMLTVLSEPAAALFLQHESRALCERINAYLGRKAVSKLRFVQGRVQVAAVGPANPQLPAKPTADDPARRFRGSERLQSALMSLAGARRVYPSD
ncbi:MAG: DUF721 domain-containing protein [Rhizomicrobium sp.]